MLNTNATTANSNRSASGRGMLPGSGEKKVTKASKRDTLDHVLLFYPTDGRHPGKTFTGPANEKLKSGPFPGGYECHALRQPVHDGRSLSYLRAVTAIAGSAYILRAELTPGTNPRKPLTRTKNPKPGKRATITSGCRRWGMIDLDGVHNMDDIDPRTNPSDAISYLLSLLPPAIAASDLGWEWSSSLCVHTPEGEAPDTLRAHLWVYLDAGLDETEWKKCLVRMNAFVAARLAALGAEDVSRNFVDFKLAEAQQPHYVAVPRFVDGATDPFTSPHRPRIGEHLGGRPSVSLVDLDRELAADEALRPKVTARTSASERKARAERAERPARTPRALRIPSAQSIVPLALVRDARDAMAAEIASRGHDAVSRRARCTELFIHRALLETVTLTVARRERGERDARWATWARDGGVPDGQRATVATMISSLVLEAAPLGLSRREASDRVVSVMRLVMDEAWIQDEWLACRFDASVLDHYARASAGEKDMLGRDARYHYRVTGCREVMQPDDDEVVDLKLISLGGRGRAREALRNEKAGHQVQEDRYAEAIANRRRVAQAVADGCSQREVMARLGMSRSAVLKALAKAEVQALIVELRDARPVADVVVMPVVNAVRSSGSMSVEVAGSDVVPFPKPSRGKVLGAKVTHAVAGAG